MLAYGGLRWSYAEVLGLPIYKRLWFVERLREQREFERKEAGGKA